MGVYCQLADEQAVQSNGDAYGVAVLWCTVVSDHNDLSTGGVIHDPD